jgi:hypothetical protein
MGEIRFSERVDFLTIGKSPSARVRKAARVGLWVSGMEKNTWKKRTFCMFFARNLHVIKGFFPTFEDGENQGTGNRE